MSAVDWVCKKISLESALEQLSAITISRQQVLPIKLDACANVTTCCCRLLEIEYLNFVLAFCLYAMFSHVNLKK